MTIAVPSVVAMIESSAASVAVMRKHRAASIAAMKEQDATSFAYDEGAWNGLCGMNKLCS